MLAEQLIWLLRYDRDGYSVEAAEIKGREFPQWFLDRPDEDFNDGFYIRAFDILNTCRVGGDQGCIPWNHIIQYGQREGLDDDMLNVFIIVIMTMDAAYRNWVMEQRPNG